jgi:hypothetical protein
MSDLGDQQSTPEKPNRRRVRLTAITVGVVVGLLLAAVGSLEMARIAARNQANREKQLLQERRQLEARLAEVKAMGERLRKEAAERKRKKRDGEWVCDKYPCNQGDLYRPAPPPPPGDPATGPNPYQDPMAPKLDRRRR